MTVQIPSANTLLDQTFFSQVATDLNALNDKITKQSSQIYNTVTDKQVTSFAGSFAISTNQIEVSHKLSTTTITLSNKPIAFNANFVAPPVVVATIQSSNATSSSAKNLANISVTNVTQNGADIYVVLDKAPDSNNATITYKVNVVAIGLVSL